MAWTPIADNAAQGNSNPIAITHGLSIQANDLIVVYINSNLSTGTLTPIDGTGGVWNEGTQELNPGTMTAIQAMFWKAANASEPATFEFTGSGAAEYGITVHQFRGDGPPVVDAAAVTARRDLSSALLFGDATNGAVVSDGAVSVVGAGKDRRSGNANPIGAADNGYTSVGNIGTEQATGSAYRIFPTGQTLNFNVTFNSPGPTGPEHYSIHMSWIEGSAAPSVDNVNAEAVPATDTTLPGAQATISNGDGGTAWAAVYADGTPDPGHDAIKNGTGAVPGTVPVQVGVADDPETVTFPPISNLSPDTTYLLWVTAEASDGTPAAVGNSDRFVTLQPQVSFIISLVDVETGDPWAEGATINWFKWRDENWNPAPTLGAPDAQDQDTTGPGGVLTVEAFEDAGQISVFSLTERLGGSFEADNFGHEVSTAVNALVDGDGNALYVEAPEGSDNYVPLQVYLQVRARGGIPAIIVGDGTVDATRLP